MAWAQAFLLASILMAFGTMGWQTAVAQQNTPQLPLQQPGQFHPDGRGGGIYRGPGGPAFVTPGPGGDRTIQTPQGAGQFHSDGHGGGIYVGPGGPVFVAPQPQVPLVQPVRPR